MKRVCDDCEGLGRVAISAQGQVYHANIDPTLMWPSSTAEWRDAFKAGLSNVSCETCKGTGEIEESESRD